ncbi:MAG: hypothetical protein IJW05_03245 [Lentisphaeria bacterium]|nr:hypothetical protein [Lentisphaeria bacterium]
MKNQKKCQLFAAVELIVIIVIVVGLLAVVMFFCAKNAANEKKQRYNCQMNFKQIAQAFANYTASEDSHYPVYSDNYGTDYKKGSRALAILLKTGELTDFSVFICPSTKMSPAKSVDSFVGHTSYAYVPGLDKFSASADSGIMADGHGYSKKPNHEMFGHILFADGHVGINLGTKARNWIEKANWKKAQRNVDESWLETRTEERYQIGPRIN